MQSPTLDLKMLADSVSNMAWELGFFLFYTLHVSNSYSTLERSFLKGLFLELLGLYDLSYESHLAIFRSVPLTLVHRANRE